MSNALTLTLRAQNLTGAAFKDLKRDLDEYGIQITRVSAKSASAAKEIEDASRRKGSALASASREATKFGESFASAMGVAVPLSAAAAGVAVASAIKLSVDAAVSFETAFAGVKKTVDATDQEFGQLRDGIRGMALQIPAAREEIAGVAEAAGQLGIKKEALLGFTRVMIDLGNTTNLSADDAATSLARLANITQMPQTEFSRLGSTVVELGNKLASTEREIVEMGLRLAGAGQQIGLTEAEILGMAGALSSVGIEAEAGGTAFSTVMVDIANSVAKGDAKLQGFADVAGMSAEQFADAFRTNAAGAIIAFVQGLGRASDAGENTFEILELLELGEIRVRDALLRASGAGDLLTEAVNTGTKAWEDNNALTDEAAKRYETTESKIDVTKNKVGELALKLGEALIPAVRESTRFIDLLGQKLGAWPTEAPPAEQIKRFDGLAVAAGIAASGISTLWEAIRTGRPVQQVAGERLGVLVQQLLTHNEATASAAGAVEVYNTKLSNLNRIYEQGGIAYADYLAAAQLLEEEFQANTAAATATAAAAETVANAVEEVAEAVAGATEEEKRNLAEQMKAREAARKAEEKAAKDAAAEAKRQADEAKRRAEQLAKDISGANADATESYRVMMREIGDVVEDGFERIDEIRQRHDDEYNGAIQSAIDEQTVLKDRASAELVKVEEKTGQDVLRVKAGILAIEQGFDEASLERKKRLLRAQEDLEIQASERGADRDEQRLQLKQSRLEAEAALETAFRAQGDRAIGSRNDADGQLNKARADAEREKNRALGRATTDEQRNAARQSYRDAMARAGEAHTEALRRIRETALEEQQRNKDTRDQKLKAITEQEKSQEAGWKKQDEREIARRELQRKRDDEDFTERQGKAKARLADELIGIETTAKKRLEEIARTRDAEIEASNNALTKKQEQLDRQRDTDYGKFLADQDRRYRDMEQRFADSMKRMAALIPDRVGAIVGNVSGALADAAGTLAGGLPVGGDGLNNAGAGGGKAASSQSGEQALSWAQAKLGSADWAGMCQRFVENAFGTSGVYGSAKDAAQALMTNRGGSLTDAPRGALVFFKPDQTNGGFGHVGISQGNGKFVSSTYQGVRTDGASQYWSGLYQGWGMPNFPRRRGGGPVSKGQPYIVGEVEPEVFVPSENGAILPSVPGGGGPITYQFHFHGSVMAPDIEDLVVRATERARRRGRL